nr:hypothetical protein Iba_chr04bCG16110 [Ipomoea batatas]
MERKNEDQPASDAITSCAFNGWENQPRGGKEPNSDAVKGSVSPLSSSEAGFQFGGTLPGSGLGFLVVYRKESMARVEALNVKYWGRTVHDDDAAGYLRQSVGHCMLGADDQKAITKEIYSARHSISRAAKTAVPLTEGQKERLKATSTVSFDFRNKSAHGALGDLKDDRPCPFSTTGMLVEGNSCGGTGSLEPTLFKI